MDTRTFTEEEVKNYINVKCIKNGDHIIHYAPLQWVAKNGHLETVKYLVDKGADITMCGNYAVRWAAGNGHLKIVKYLVENGADITAGDNYAVRWAAGNGHLETVKYLLSTYIYPEEDVYRHARELTLRSDIKELLTNYRKFSYKSM